MNVLAYAHPPQNHCRLCSGKLARDFSQGFCWDTTNGCHCFRTISFDIFLEGFKVICTIFDEGLIYQILFDDGVNHCIQHCHIGVGLELHRTPSMLGNIGLTRIAQNNLGATFSGILKPGCCNRVIGCGVRSNQHNQAGVLHIIDLITYRTRSNTL